MSARRRLGARGWLCLIGLIFAAGRVDCLEKQVVSVILMSDGRGMYQGSLLYPSVVDKARGQAEMNELWERSGWIPASVEWSTVPAVKRFPARSSLDFTVGTLYPKDVFPVEAFAMAYRRYGGVDLTAVKTGPFPAIGPPHFENADATMDMSVAGNVLNVSVRVKNPDLKGLQFAPLTTHAPVAPIVQTPARRRRLSIWVILPLGLLAAGVTWVLVYALAIGQKKEPGTGTESKPAAPKAAE